MITFTDALEGLNKWKGRSNEAFKSRDRMARAHKTQPDIEAMCKYFYYLGACNAYVTSDLIVAGKTIVEDVRAKSEWLGGRRYDL